VEHADAVLRHRSEAHLRAAGGADLARDDHVQRGAEGTGDLVGDGHAAARQPEHDRMSAGPETQAIAERTAGVVPVGERRP
jgi:hypothetical protein